MARPILTPPDPNPNGIAEMEWVRRIGTKGVGIVESVRGDCAVVNWWNGSKSIVPCALLQMVDYGRDL
jgi:hypothetical protein